jgi:hypothetical protein
MDPPSGDLEAGQVIRRKMRDVKKKKRLTKKERAVASQNVKGELVGRVSGGMGVDHWLILDEGHDKQDGGHHRPAYTSQRCSKI